MTADPTDLHSFRTYRRPTLEEILQDESVKTVENIHDLAIEGFFESDEELEAFLRFNHEQRQSDLG